MDQGVDGEKEGKGFEPAAASGVCAAKGPTARGVLEASDEDITSAMVWRN